jgi:D-tyrosyl-tRNA(Tyr) deacylase
MKVLLQRVSRASASTGGGTAGSIGRGVLALAGFGRGDTGEDVSWMCSKLAALRIFPDHSGAMNLSLADVGGAVLAVSQFTLHADCARGRRPSFTRACEPGAASALFDLFVARLRTMGLEVATGVFGAEMSVELVNEGPVTIMLESPSERR